MIQFANGFIGSTLVSFGARYFLLTFTFRNCGGIFFSGDKLDGVIFEIKRLNKLKKTAFETFFRPFF